MGQAQIIKILKKSKKPLSRGEIAYMLGESPIKISIILKKLLKFGEIKAIKLNRKKAKRKYNCKRTMRLYYLK